MSGESAVPVDMPSGSDDSSKNVQYKSKWKKAVKSWKKIKDEDKERPPWRSVSVSTVPKADKNALLRAKLLDASRRLRLSKLSIATQVELPIYKPSRTIGIHSQKDLIAKQDVSILTDGSITLKKEGPGEFILTHSASQMTEAIVGVDVATQTLLPRQPTRFLEAYLSNKPYDRDAGFTDTEKNLLDQIREIRAIDRELCKRSKNFDEMSEDSITSCGDKTAIKEYFNERTKSARTRLKPTLSSWHFEYSDDDEPLWKPYTTKPTPWSSFVNTDAEDRLSNMKLQPVLGKPTAPYAAQEIALNLELFAAVEELLIETETFIETLNRMSTMVRPEIKRKEAIPPGSFHVECLSDYWLPIVNKLEENVERLTRERTYPKVKDARPITMAELDTEYLKKSN